MPPQQVLPSLGFAAFRARRRFDIAVEGDPLVDHHVGDACRYHLPRPCSSGRDDSMQSRAVWARSVASSGACCIWIWTVEGVTSAAWTTNMKRLREYTAIRWLDLRRGHQSTWTGTSLWGPWWHGCLLEVLGAVMSEPLVMCYVGCFCGGRALGLKCDSRLISAVTGAAQPYTT